MSTGTDSLEPQIEHNPSSIFALVIGINDYRNSTYPSLRYATKDADRFEQYLSQSLGVPPANITSLRDEGAHRAAILDGFQSLIRDHRIKMYDPIIIYFAGHGGRVPKPKEWVDWHTCGPQIEILCPSDLGVVVDGNQPVGGIPDRTISSLLQKLSMAKGDNITLILDCCSSAGMSRGVLNLEEDLVRQIPNPPYLFSDCDRSIWGTPPCVPPQHSRGVGTFLGFSGGYHESHILLAACGVDQVAIERPRIGGLFTSQLLHILKDPDSFRDLTYITLMNKFRMPSNQTPHCEGRNIGRRLFNRLAPGANREFVLGHYDGDTGRISLNVGDAHDISPRSFYSVHNSVLDPGPENEQLSTIVITEVGPLRSIAQFAESSPTDIPPLFYARKIGEGQRKPYLVYCPEGKLLSQIFPDKQSMDALGVAFTTFADRAQLSILLDDQNRTAVFERKEEQIIRYIGSRLPHSVLANDHHSIRKVIKCAINFHRQLKQFSEDVRNVELELRELILVESNEFTDRIPVGPNLLQGDIAVVPVERLFSLTILNQTSLPLYPHVFYLEPSDLSISSWYSPAMGGNSEDMGSVDTPLPPKSALTLGYGDSATDPWTFGLPDGKEIDVGVFKVFLTTTPSDFSALLQDSPFYPLTKRQLESPNTSSTPALEIWGTKMVTVVQKRWI